MTATAIIQARTASSRLPSKVLLPLGGTPMIQHIVRRAQAANVVDEVIVATTFHTRDDMVEWYAAESGSRVVRGSEDDVLGRLCAAVSEAKNDVIVRLTGDNPFVSPALIDEVAGVVADDTVRYASNKLDRTFPIGVDAEAMAGDTLLDIERSTTNPSYREHATKYLRTHPDQFNTHNVTVEDVFGSEGLAAGPELRLTLDEPQDYQLYKLVYDQLDYDRILDVTDAIEYILSNELQEMNNSVIQKTL